LAANVRQVAAHGCGALVTQSAGRAAQLVPPQVGDHQGSGNGEVRADGGVDTLLGPEGTGASPGPLDCGTDVPCGSVWRVRSRLARLFFENCTVDASISGE
jgi:hypothetical protein